MIDDLLSRRSFVTLAGLSSVFWGLRPRPAAAAICPDLSGQTLDFIVPFSPGGGFDTYSRLLEPVLERYLEAEVVVTNQRGAGGVIGAKALRDSDPDGRTLGILNASGLMIARLAGAQDVPSITEDYTLLGRVTRDFDVWVTAADGPFDNVSQIIDRSARQAVVFGTIRVPSEDWLSGVVGSHLLGIQLAFLAGYPGSSEQLLGLIRGEFDLMSLSWDSARPHIESGELRAVLQVSDRPIAAHPSLKDVPVMAGDDGLVAELARGSGRDPAAAAAQASALAETIAAGRIVAAPTDLPEPLATCLDQAVGAALTDPGFVASVEQAGRSLDTARGTDVHKVLTTARDAAADLVPVIKRSLAESRQ